MLIIYLPPDSKRHKDSELTLLVKPRSRYECTCGLSFPFYEE